MLLPYILRGYGQGVMGGWGWGVESLFKGVTLGGDKKKFQLTESSDCVCLVRVHATSHMADTDPYFLVSYEVL